MGKNCALYSILQLSLSSASAFAIIGSDETTYDDACARLCASLFDVLL